MLKIDSAVRLSFTQSVKIASQQHSETGHGLSWLFWLNTLFDLGCFPLSLSSEFFYAKDRLCRPVIFYAESVKIASKQHSETGHGLSWVFCLNTLFDLGCVLQSFSIWIFSMLKIDYAVRYLLCKKVNIASQQHSVANFVENSQDQNRCFGKTANLNHCRIYCVVAMLS